MVLQWNVQERAQRALAGQEGAAQRRGQEQQEREALRAGLAFWRAQLAAHEEALPVWQAEHRRRLQAQGAAWVGYLEALHAAAGGELPRASTGELITHIELSDDHPETVAARPAQGQLRAFHKAEEEAIYAGDVVRRLAAAIMGLRHNVKVCAEA